MMLYTEWYRRLDASLRPKRSPEPEPEPAERAPHPGGWVYDGATGAVEKKVPSNKAHNWATAHGRICDPALRERHVKNLITYVASRPEQASFKLYDLARAIHCNNNWIREVCEAAGMVCIEGMYERAAG